MFLMPDNKWARLLAYVTGLVNQKLLLQNEYLAAENRILRAHLPARIRLSNPERSTLSPGTVGSLPANFQTTFGGCSICPTRVSSGPANRPGTGQ